MLITPLKMKTSLNNQCTITNNIPTYYSLTKANKTKMVLLNKNLLDTQIFVGCDVLLNTILSKTPIPLLKCSIEISLVKALIIKIVFIIIGYRYILVLLYLWLYIIKWNNNHPKLFVRISILTHKKNHATITICRKRYIYWIIYIHILLDNFKK